MNAEHVLPSDMGYSTGAAEAANSVRNTMRAVARKEFAEMVPLCATCGCEIDHESCYCDECEAKIQ